MIALAFSGGKDSMACLHLMRDKLDFAIYVDTGFAYPETKALVKYAAHMLPMHVVKSDRKGQNQRAGIPADVVPVDWTPLGQACTGQKRYLIQPYLDCCYENISYPLYMKAKELGVTEMVSGQRLEEKHKSPSRDGTNSFGIIRRHPIEKWTTQEVMDYLATKMEVPEHYKIKHSSLDCYDCSAYRNESSDRVKWTKEKHPDLYGEYLGRVTKLDCALKEAQPWP